MFYCTIFIFYGGNMELPIGLKNIIEEMASRIDTKKLAYASRNMTEKYKNESGNGKRLVSDTVETAAYATVRMPATFGAVSSALLWTKEHFDGEIHTIIDVGAGTGAAGWAAAEIFDEAEKLTCIEREENMISFGSRLMEEGDFPVPYEWKKADISSENCTEKADLVTASYVLNELSEGDCIRTAEKLWDIAGKLLVIIEPGTVTGYNNIRKIRERLISLGGYIVAPCPHCDACPVSENDWCHFSARISRTRLHKLLKGGDVPFEDEKFSYIAVSKEPVEGAERRILRHPKNESGHIGLCLCTKSGIGNITVTKKEQKLFKKARKASWGDEI